MIINKPIEFSIKLISALAAIGYIVYRLAILPDLDETWDLFLENIAGAGTGIILLVICLMPLTWAVEVQKWRYLMARNYPVAFGKAVRAVLSGLSMALLTPNRVGEIATRVLVLPKEHRLKGIWLGSLGGLAQIVVNLIFGIDGGSFLIMTNDDVNIALLSNNFLILSLGIMGGILVIASYFYLHRIVEWINSWKWLPFKKKHYRVLKQISARNKLLVLGISAIKYCIYLNQFYFIIIICDIPISWTQGLMALSVVFLIMTFIPMAALADVGIRGSVTLMVVGLYADLPINILAASFLIWVINIAIPSLIGLILLIKIKF